VANSVSKQYGPEYVLNGTIMWNGMRQIQFEGMGKWEMGIIKCLF
jgi:hypothetical protein